MTLFHWKFDAVAINNNIKPKQLWCLWSNVQIVCNFLKAHFFENATKLLGYPLSIQLCAFYACLLIISTLKTEYYAKGVNIYNWEVMTTACAFNDQHWYVHFEESISYFEKKGLIIFGIIYNLNYNFGLKMISVNLDTSFFEEIHLHGFDVWILRTKGSQLGVIDGFELRINY